MRVGSCPVNPAGEIKDLICNQNQVTETQPGQLRRYREDEVRDVRQGWEGFEWLDGWMVGRLD